MTDHASPVSIKWDLWLASRVIDRLKDTGGVFSIRGGLRTDCAVNLVWTGGLNGPEEDHVEISLLLAEGSPPYSLDADPDQFSKIEVFCDAVAEARGKEMRRISA